MTVALVAISLLLAANVRTNLALEKTNERLAEQTSLAELRASDLAVTNEELDAERDNLTVTNQELDAERANLANCVHDFTQ